MTTTTRPYKWGDTRSDGYRFKAYHISGRELWFSPKAFERHRFSQAVVNARKRSREQHVPFDITVNYLQEIFPEDGKCPVFITDMVFGSSNRNDSPSLDRIVPELGYVEGNVIWISNRANRLKQEASLDEMKRLYDFYANLHTTRH